MFYLCLWSSDVQLLLSGAKRKKLMATWLYSLFLDELVSSNLLSWIIHLQQVRRKNRSINTVYSIADHKVKIKSTVTLGLTFNKNKVAENTKLIGFYQIMKVNG